MAGKTGTPQNWSDAWTVGYSPYYTTAVWFGFDRPGNSLGLSLTGSTLAGPVWADYMREIHQGLPFKDFVRPASGLIDVTVCAKSGLLKTEDCNQGELTFPFLEGTQPDQYCNIHGSTAYSSRDSINVMAASALTIDDKVLINSLPMPTLNLDLFPETRSGDRAEAGGSQFNAGGTAASSANRGQRGNARGWGNRGAAQGNDSFLPEILGPGNPLLDGGEDTAPMVSREAPEAAPADYGLELPDYNPLLD
jgi:penicillin-binding protein 1A